LNDPQTFDFDAVSTTRVLVLVLAPVPFTSLFTTIHFGVRLLYYIVILVYFISYSNAVLTHFVLHHCIKIYS
jgi:hypothetical protein